MGLEDLVAARASQERMPDYFDWVLGWRHFNISPYGLCSSVSAPYLWQPGENKAKCIYTSNNSSVIQSVIHDDHHCGLNAFYEHDSSTGYGTMHALVRGRGERFAIHPDGFRAEYSEILAFIGGGTHARRSSDYNLKAAAKRYGVPLFKRHWQAERYAEKRKLGGWFPKERRPKTENEIILSPKPEIDWNEVPIGEIQFATYYYATFFATLLMCVLAGFIYGATNAGGIL